MLLRVLAPFAAGYFMSYLFRSVNAVIAPDLSMALQLSAADLGLLTSAYFLAFGLFQLPLGLLLDRYGPRRVETVLLLVAAAGALSFALSTTLSGLIVSRALIGLGVSACLMAGLKATSIWFAAERAPAMNGLIMAAGGLGALTATAPVEWALNYTDWRGVITTLAALTAVAAALIFFIVPEPPRQEVGGLRGLLGGLLGVYRSAFFWRVVPLVVLTQATYLAVQGLWVGPWLRDVAGFDRDGVAWYLLLTAAAMVAGFLLLGNIASRLQRRGVSLALTMAVCIGVFIFAQLALLLISGPTAAPLWMLFGFFGSAGILAFPLLSQYFPAQLTGRVNTAANVLVFLSAFALQWAIGAVINHWPVVGDGYDPQGYQAALWLLLAAQVVGFLWFAPVLRRGEQRPSQTDR